MDHQGRLGSSSGQPTNSPTSPAPHPSTAGSGTRGAIAHQACSQCRRKKQRCDEGQPSCGNCLKGNLKCEYQETQPTKKDKTALQILDIVTRIDHRLSSFISGQGSDSGIGSSPFSQPQTRHASTSEPATRRMSASAKHVESRAPHPSSPKMSHPYRHTTAAHKILTWPAIQELLGDKRTAKFADLESLDVEGSAFMVRLCEDMPNLPQMLDADLQERPFYGMQSTETRETSGPRSTFDQLTRETMRRLGTAYFDTFNMLYPFMDRATFFSETLAKVESEGFNGDNVSVIALLIFALGEVAEYDAQGDLVGSSYEQGIGVGSSRVERHHPGLGLFNEARKRMGFVLTECELENVQIFSLAALYYASCSYHVDFWRMTVAGSSACKILVTCRRIDWNSPHGDLVKRAYWHCVILETGLHLELDLPLTGLLDLGVPAVTSFNHRDVQPCDADEYADSMSHYRHHYSSQLTLRRLCSDLHDQINGSMRDRDSAIKSDPTSEGLGGPTTKVLIQFDLKLQTWRGLLPASLNWPENDPTSYPNEMHLNFQPTIDPSLAGTQTLFSTQPARKVFPYVYDIQVALLRTRYYYAKYMVYRPYVYKALHFPHQLTEHDADAVATCLKSCLKWPITMSPTSHRKRLTPYLFCWSQNFLGMILLLRLSQTNEKLWEIRQKYCGGEGSHFEREVEESIQLMLNWIIDLKAYCPIARWCYDILSPLYSLDDSFQGTDKEDDEFMGS